ncbi:hypothetical protein OS493_031819 [Desmophyllum pertusum]|uniref:RING-CH-type domain-containing protein n=1 Tax=Desmophyllum pertusum TaxID=174260 RepID=A0A9W9YXH7_9CNID|nr:hypothetical protein OS493_031819 [Desmophyllum pertusum]
MESLQTRTSTESYETASSSLSGWNKNRQGNKQTCLLGWVNSLDDHPASKRTYLIHHISAENSEPVKDKSLFSFEEFCRICHCGAEDGQLISPCRCSGSAKYAQPELSAVVWRLPWQSCDIVAYLFMFYCLVLIIFIAMVLWIASRRCLSPICVVLYFACGLAQPSVLLWKCSLEKIQKYTLFSQGENRKTWFVVAAAAAVVVVVVVVVVVSRDEDICRICHDNKDKEELVRVCRCNGSAKYAHKSCVLRWFQFSYRYECELCHYKMKIKKDGFKPVREWSNPCQFLSLVDFIAVLTVHVLHGIVLLMIVMVAVTNKCFSLVCISLILFCFAIVLLLFYCCDGCEFFKYCKVQWVVNNSRWSISSYDEESVHQ